MTSARLSLRAEPSWDRAAVETLVENELARQLENDPAAMREPMRALVNAGGKRLRPLLTLLASRLGPEYDAPRSVRLAAAIEFIHSATLVHDDVVDGSGLRRGMPTLNRSGGERAALAVGDFYFAKSAGILADLANPAVTRAVLSGVRAVATSQVAEIHARTADTVDEEVYLAVASGKTGALLVAACTAGALLSGSPEGVVDAMSAYATHLGLAFQIMDDVIDFAEADTGKPVGQDLRAGVRSLPVILAAGNSASGVALRDALSDPGGTERAIAIVRESGALKEASSRALALHGRAVAALGQLDDPEVCAQLEEVADQAVFRQA